MVDVVGRAKVIVETVIDKSSLDQTGGKIGKGIKTGALIGVAALGTLAAAGVKASFAFEEAEATQRKLANTLGNMGKTGAVEAVDKLSDSLMRQTGVDDEVIKRGQTILATFSEVASSAGKVGGAFEQATELSLDLAASGFGNVDGAAKALGKALQDPVKGISALGRAGVTFTPIQKQQIEDFVKGGEVAKAQAIVLEEVAKQVGGNAEAGAKGSDKLRNAFGELEEAFGHVLNTITGGDNFSGLADSIQKVADQIDRFADSEGLKNFRDAFSGDNKPELPPGTGTVLAPGAEGETGAFLPAPDEEADVWWAKFIETLVEHTDEDSALTRGDKKLMAFIFGEDGLDQEIDELIADIEDGGLVDSVSNVLEDMEDSWRDGWEKITDIWPEIQAAFAEDWENLERLFSDGWEAIKIGADQFIQDLIDTGSDWYDAGAKLIGDFVRGLGADIKGATGNIVESIRDALNDALGLPATFFEGRDGIPTLTIPAFAGGVRNFSGGLARVGEQGPETVYLPPGSDVYTASETRQIDSGGVGGNTTVFNITGPVSLAELRQRAAWYDTYGTRFG